MEAIQNGVPVDQPSTTRGAARYPDRLLYALWALFCVIMIGVAVRDYYRGGGQSLWKPLLWEGSSMSFATLLLALQRTVARRSYDRWLGQPIKWFGQHLKWFPLCLPAFLVVVYGVRDGVYALLGETYDHDPWVVLVPYEAIKLLLFTGLWLGVIFAFDSFARWHAQQRHLLDLQRALAESRLATLSSQLRPHFFFNSLNTISALMHMDVERADRLLARLGELLRASLQSSGQDLVPLAEELRLLELYAQIMLERFADRVTVEWRVEDAALKFGVPPMLMQPLLENAFKHAVERGREKVCIEIAAVRENDELVLSVRNNGSSLPPNWRDGVGLRNCRERLQVIYGAAAVARLSESAAGVQALVSLPCREPSA
ncbi:MAG: sensor histidine kinase [Steroidobacteraceae bacterium]